MVNKMPLEPRISLVTLGVADVARATAFYEKLGWKKTSGGDSISFFQLRGTVLGLYGRAALAEDAGVGNTPPGFSGVTLAYNTRSEAETDAAYETALACGATPVKQPQKVFWGGYSGYFADPDGHLWEVAYNPFSPLDEDGHMVMSG